MGYALAPISRLFCMAVSARRFAYEKRLIATQHPGIPVIVVGNITTGGTGKTPLIVWLANFLRRHGFYPAIMARGYGGQADDWPQWVNANSDPSLVGDEAVLLARRTSCRVVAAPSRVAAAKMLVEQTDCNIILCDDGLQHYALERDVEIAVVDEVLGIGNGRCLPAGPLREPVSRLAEVDFVITHTRDRSADFGEHGPSKHRVDTHGMTKHAMRLIPGEPMEVAGGDAKSLDAFKKAPVHAVCGIGHPERFFEALRRLGLVIKPHAFPDHHVFQAEELTFGDGLRILMTEKDAVKCRRFADSRHWYLPVEAELDPTFGARLLKALARLRLDVSGNEIF